MMIVYPKISSRVLDQRVSGTTERVQTEEFGQDSWRMEAYWKETGSPIPVHGGDR